MDAAASEFVRLIDFDPWGATSLPLPDSLDDLDALRWVRLIFYALVQTLSWSLDDSLDLMGERAEIDRRIAMIEQRSSRRPDCKSRPFVASENGRRGSPNGEAHGADRCALAMIRAIARVSPGQGIAQLGFTPMKGYP
jgi:hypothetical protein